MMAPGSRRSSIVCATFIAAALFVSLAAPAFAGQRQSAPTTIRFLDFETTGARSFPQNFPIAPVPTIDPLATSAYWGRTTKVDNGGLYGFWCAGSRVGGGVSFWPKYPRATRGAAKLPVNELANYYRAWLSFDYLIPSLGGADKGETNTEESFRYGWETPSGSGIRHAFEGPGLTSTWKTLTKDLSNGNAQYNIRRTGATLDLQFFDYDEAVTPGAVGQNGQGPAIDNFRVYGYKYGPVRSLAPSVAADGHVTLTWGRPYRSIGTTVQEERPITYRVWRMPAGGAAWTELTSATSRYSTTTLHDVTTARGTTYHYVVQAWDAGTGGGYGQEVVYPRGATALTISTPVAPSGGFLTGVPLAVSGKLSPVHAVGSRVVDLQVSRDKSTIAGTYSGLSQSGGTTFKGTVKVTSPGTWYVRARHSDAAHSETFSGWVPITASLPFAALSAPTKPSGTVYMWTSFTSTGRISATHPSAAPVIFEFSRNTRTITKTMTGRVGAGSTTYSVAGVKLAAPGAWYIRTRHQDSTHRLSRSAWTRVVISPLVKVTAPRVKTHKGRTYSVYGTIKPRHSSAYLRVYAYRWNGRKYAYVKSFAVRATSTGQAVDTSRYTSSVKFTKKGYWKLRLRHAGHAGEATRYSAYSSRIKVK